MSLCICPQSSSNPDICTDIKQFLNSIAPDGVYGKSGWSLLTLMDMYEAGNSLEEIAKTIPFKPISCKHSLKCCGTCTKQCYTRCIHDCLHRLWMWNQLVENTPVEERDKLPLAVRLIVNQEFESHAHMSWCVSEILSCRTNTQVAKMMLRTGVPWHQHPYYNDYSPSYAYDEQTGKRIINPSTGELKLANWPESGLCPYCLPKVTVDSRGIKVRDYLREGL